jgi:hypothetical protein
MTKRPLILAFWMGHGDHTEIVDTGEVLGIARVER